GLYLVSIEARIDASAAAGLGSEAAILATGNAGGGLRRVGDRSIYHRGVCGRFTGRCAVGGAPDVFDDGGVHFHVSTGVSVCGGGACRNVYRGGAAGAGAACGLGLYWRLGRNDELFRRDVSRFSKVFAAGLHGGYSSD